VDALLVEVRVRGKPAKRENSAGGPLGALPPRSSSPRWAARRLLRAFLLAARPLTQISTWLRACCFASPLVARPLAQISTWLRACCLTSPLAARSLAQIST
jgi:hypothetical protein